MARSSIARKQKRKTQATARKVVRRRAMPARIKLMDTQRPADEVRSGFETERAIGADVGQDHQETGGTNPASASPVSEAHAVGTAMQAALHLLLALSFLSLQMWQNALGVRRLEH